MIKVLIMNIFFCDSIIALSAWAALCIDSKVCMIAAHGGFITIVD